MGAIDILTIGIKAGGALFDMAKQQGLIGAPDWAKYVDAGVYVSAQALAIAKDVIEGRSRYDSATPAQILTMLLPASFEDLELRAKLELAAAA